jgi:hypothetical protein
MPRPAVGRVEGTAPTSCPPWPTGWPVTRDVTGELREMIEAAAELDHRMLGAHPA